MCVYIYTYINTYSHTCTFGCELRQVANPQKGGWRIAYHVWERLGIPTYTLYIFKGPCVHPFCRFHDFFAVNNCTSNIHQPSKTPVVASCELQPKNHSQHEKKYKVILLMANLECSISWLVPHHHLSHKKKTALLYIGCLIGILIMVYDNLLMCGQYNPLYTLNLRILFYCSPLYHPFLCIKCDPQNWPAKVHCIPPKKHTRLDQKACMPAIHICSLRLDPSPKKAYSQKRSTLWNLPPPKKIARLELRAV